MPHQAAGGDGARAAASRSAALGRLLRVPAGEDEQAEHAGDGGRERVETSSIANTQDSAAASSDGLRRAVRQAGDLVERAHRPAPSSACSCPSSSTSTPRARSRASAARSAASQFGYALVTSG